MTSDGWAVEARPVAPELEAGYQAQPYDANDYRIGLMTPVLEKLNDASLEQLSRILGGWPVRG